MKNYLLSIAQPLRMCLRHCAVILFPFVITALWTNPAQAAANGKEVGARLLRAELPTGMSIQKADCEQLSRAVGRATVAHRTDAPAILGAALTNGSTTDALKDEEKRPCQCVAGIVRASVKVAPEQASALLDVALALYPDCSDTLTAILDEAKKALTAYDYRDYKEGANQPVAGINNVNHIGDPTGLAFGGGQGPGFPGAPGFSGSSPSSGDPVLPPASGAQAATNVANE